MKNFQFLIATIAIVFAISLSSCQKEEVADLIPVEPEEKNVVLAGWFKTSNIFGECDPGMGFCGSILAPSVASQMELSRDEAKGTGTVKNDVIHLTLTENNFSQELKNMLQYERIFEVSKDYQLSQELVENIYRNAGLDVPVEPVKIAAGVYDVHLEEHTDPTGQLLSIKITIKIGPVEISIEW